MADYRKFFDDKWVKAYDLDGKELTVVIQKVEAGTLDNHRTKTQERKPIVWFRGAKKPLALNKTNAKTIAGLYTNETERWVGQAITIYPTRTMMGGEEVDCIRVRPKVPKGKGQDMPAPPPPPEDPPSEGDDPAKCASGTCGACDWCHESAAAAAGMRQ